MSLTLTINGRSIDAAPGGGSIFDYAERVGVQVPTSCIKNGKCKECVVEVSEGIELLTPRTKHEEHLKGNFRLSCQVQVASASGQVKCHTMRRGQMRIERHAFGLPI